MKRIAAAIALSILALAALALVTDRGPERIDKTVERYSKETR